MPSINRPPATGKLRLTGIIAADQPEVSGGVRVTRGDQTLAELRCAAGSTIVRDFYSVFEAKEAKGQCWDNGSFSWGPC